MKLKNNIKSTFILMNACLVISAITLRADSSVVSEIGGGERGPECIDPDFYQSSDTLDGTTIVIDGRTYRLTLVQDSDIDPYPDPDPVPDPWPPDPIPDPTPDPYPPDPEPDPNPPIMDSGTGISDLVYRADTVHVINNLMFKRVPMPYAAERSTDDTVSEV